MRARDVMTTDVVTVDLDTSVREIARLLLARRISAVPVVAADGRLAGIVSEGDLVRRPELGTEARPSWWLMLFAGSEDLAQSYRKAHGRRAADVMTHDVVTVAEDAPVSEIARLLEERRFKRVPVIRDGRVVGVVSRADLVRGLAVQRAPTAVPADDNAIRERCLRSIRDTGLRPPPRCQRDRDRRRDPPLGCGVHGGRARRAPRRGGEHSRRTGRGRAPRDRAGVVNGGVRSFAP